MVEIKFIIGHEEEDHVCVHGPGSGIYTVSTMEDYEYFPVPDGLVKVLLPDDFNEKELCDSFCPESHCYKKGIDKTGQIRDI